MPRPKRANGEGCFVELPDGRWLLRRQNGNLSNGNPHIISVRARTKAECQKKMKQRLEKNNRDISSEYAAMTLSQLCNAHLDYHISQVSRLKPKSIDGRRMTIRNQIDKYDIGSYPIVSIRPQDINAHIEELISSKSYRGTSLSVSTVKKAYDVINSAYKWVMSQGLEIKNPCVPVKDSIRNRLTNLIVKKSCDADVCILSNKDIETFIKAKDSLKDKNHNLYYCTYLPALLLLETGMRSGELCALRWNDYDRNNKTLRIERTRYQTEAQGNGYITEEGPVKNYHKRVIVLSDRASEVLNELWIFSHNNDYIVLNTKYKPTNPSNFGVMLNKVYSMSGLSGVTGAHTFRRTCATRMHNAGASIKSIAAYLGDKEGTILKHYIAARERYQDAEGNAYYVVPLPTQD